MVCEDAFGVITIVNNVVSMMNQLKGKIMADFYYIQINNTHQLLSYFIFNDYGLRLRLANLNIGPFTFIN
jgi:hypothetical protein